MGEDGRGANLIDIGNGLVVVSIAGDRLHDQLRNTPADLSIVLAHPCHSVTACALSSYMFARCALAMMHSVNSGASDISSGAG